MNLGLHCREFFELSKISQKKVIDYYFKHLDSNFDVLYYFDNKNSRYIEDSREISFFNSEYFCRKVIKLNINNLALIDKFSLPKNKINDIINDVVTNIKKDNIRFNINDILVYPNNLPLALSSNIIFLKYIIGIDVYNIKYITYNEDCSYEERVIIKDAIDIIKKDKFDIEKFYINNKLPKILKNNTDFIIYVIENDINGINYLNSKILSDITLDVRNKVIGAIISFWNNNDMDLDYVFSNRDLGLILSVDYEFISYAISRDVYNIRYVDFHNMSMDNIKRVIDKLALKLVREKIDFDVEKFHFRNVLKGNYMFMAYLINKDKRYIKEIGKVSRDDAPKLIDIYLNKYRKCEFDIKNYINNDGFIDNCLIENRRMFSYLIRHDNRVFKYIDFLTLCNSKSVIDVMLREMEKKDFVFDNGVFLRNNKYPIILSNSYRFMRYVIDVNFNNLSYMDISMCDEKELKRIINYAFRLVYYIRGNNKNLSFDIEGYFKGTDIINNDYFKLCLNSL